MISTIHPGRHHGITAITGIILILFALADINCSSSGSLTGTGSQSGNGRIAGVALSPDGTPAANAVVRVRLQNYTAAKALQKSCSAWRDMRTDANGRFAIDSLDTGKYYVEVNDERAHAVLLSCTLSRQYSQVDLQNGVLQPTGSIQGSFLSKVDSVPMYVQICGLERSGIRDQETGGFVINDVPAGVFTVRVLAASSSYQPVDIQEVKVSSGTVSSIDPIDYVRLGKWRYSKRLYFNTTATGVQVSGLVRDFPVLVRLNSNNFDFKNANSDGSDLLFTKANGAVLPFEIEHWDSQKNSASVWFKMDTLIGGDSSRFVTMYWGNPLTVTMSSRKDVFDTAAHFAGVWHLNDTGLVSADATVNNNHGTNSGCTQSDGIIGASKHFSSGTFVKIPGLFNSPLDVTLSAWIESDTTTGQDVISIGDVILIRLDEPINTAGTSGSYHIDTLDNISSFALTSSGVTLAKSGWRYVVYSFNSSTNTQILYIDGLQVAVTNSTLPIQYTGVGKDTYLGIHGNGKTIFNFVGRLDEVRVQNTVVSADWVRLCYENQKASDALLQIR
jgi:hypothetical protein